MTSEHASMAAFAIRSISDNLILISSRAKAATEGDTGWIGAGHLPQSLALQGERSAYEQQHTRRRHQ